MSDTETNAAPLSEALPSSPLVDPGDRFRAVVSVLGVDRVGIVAAVSTLLAEHGVNILDIRQTLLNDLFSMIMVVGFSEDSASLSEVQERLGEIADSLGVKAYLQHEAVFRRMHRVEG